LLTLLHHCHCLSSVSSPLVRLWRFAKSVLPSLFHITDICHFQTSLSYPLGTFEPCLYSCLCPLYHRPPTLTVLYPVLIGFSFYMSKPSRSAMSCNPQHWINTYVCCNSSNVVLSFSMTPHVHRIHPFTSYWLYYFTMYFGIWDCWII